MLRTPDNKYSGTFWNEDANRLLQEFPNVFEICQTQELIKGRDY